MIVLAEKTRADLGWDTLLGYLAQRCHTDLGAALARALAPFDDVADAHARQEEVREARMLQDTGEGLSFGGVRDLRTALSRAEKGGVLFPDELCDVKRTLRAGAALKRHLLARSARAPRLLGRAALLAELNEVAGPIDDAFDDGGTLRDSASPALKGLRRRAQDLQADLSSRAEGLLDREEIAPHLQDRFVTQREGRYVVPVRVDARSRVRGIVHGQSASGATVFVEPEDIIDLNNRLKLAQLEVSEEERRILADLSQRVQHAAARIRANLDILSVLDLIDGGATLARDLRAAPVQLQLGDGQPLDLRNARHPLLLLGGVQVVPNDVRVPCGGALVLSGPNAGGKTVVLKLCGLFALMARSGLHCPAQEGSSLPVFDAVYTDVGDEQSLERSLSTFSAHVLHLCHFLSQAAPRALVLLDEIAGGTDPEQGAALAQAVLEALLEKGATVIVTTHYDRLKALATHDARFVNASVGYDLDRLAPTYRLHLGVPGASGAVLVARRLGLPPQVVTRAESILGASKTGVEELLQSLAREREGLLELRAQAERERAQAEAASREAAELRAQARRELQQARKAAHDEAVAALRKARVELDEAHRELRRAREAGPGQGPGQGQAQTGDALRAARKRVDELARDIAQAAPPAEAGPARMPGPEDLAVGRRVWVPQLAGVGTIMSDVLRDKVVVQVGALKLNVNARDLRLPDETPGAPSGKASSPSAGAARPRAPAGPRSLPVRTQAATLDLRGERVEVALARAEKFVDTGLRDGLPAVFLLHGHGTGALREAIREHFAVFPGIVRLSPAPPEDGGDGVTVVELE